MNKKIDNFAAFMKKRVNENTDGMDYGYAGANPEEEEMDMEGMDDEDAAGEGEEEEITLEDLKAMLDDLMDRVGALEGGEEGEEEEGEEGEEEEGEEEEEVDEE